MAENPMHRNHAPGFLFAAATIVVCQFSLCQTVKAQMNDPYQFITLDCLFSKFVASSIEKGKLETKTENDNFAMTFSGFDRQKGEAILIGNAGTDRVIYFPGDRKIMLVQITDAANGSMTSISEPKNGESIAFHSRHMWLSGEPVISHYYQGRCKTRR